jgi:hypothetical protein
MLTFDDITDLVQTADRLRAHNAHRSEFIDHVTLSPSSPELEDSGKIAIIGQATLTQINHARDRHKCRRFAIPGPAIVYV